MFIGRERELAALQAEYESAEFRMTVLYGRRRVGKTKLLNHFTADRRTVFFTAVESSADNNLTGLEESIFEAFPVGDVHPHFRDFEEAFRYLGEKSAEGRTIIVIDEYPYLAEAEASLSSVLQKCIDTDWKNRNVFLILCGSSISFMEEEVLGSKSPLFGRRTSQIDLQPFDYLRAADFVPEYTAYEKAIVYGVTGGVAKYLSLFDPKEKLEENIKRLYFSESGYLYEEPKNLLRQEFRNVALYDAIIGAVAGGATSMNEISQRTGTSTASLSPALTKLSQVRIVKKDVPLLNEKNRRYTNYIVTDGMFRFWYRFLPRGIGAVTRGYGEQYYERQVRPFLHEFMGSVFERICQDFTFCKSMEGELDVTVSEIGKWRGHDDRKREPADIDVVGLDRTTGEALIGECKFRNEATGPSVIETLIDSGGLLPQCRVRQYLCFSMGGYEKAVSEMERRWPLKLFTLEDLY